MVVIIDGNHLACRCYFSLDKLSNSQGKRTELIFGFLSSFKKIVEQYNTKENYILLTWDGGNQRRKRVFSEYKAGRKPFESAFYEQLTDLRRIIDFLGIKQYFLNETEADDLIGTLATKCRKKGQKVLIVSGDHDFEQLITRHTKVLHTPKKNMIKDEQFVSEKFSIPIERICEGIERLPEIMAITGDPTDNIPGIDKVGDKTASKIVMANKNFESILEDTDNLKILNTKGEIVDAKDDIKNKIKENKEKLKISYQLVKIICDLDIELVLEKRCINQEKIKEEFEKLEFRMFLNEFDKWSRCFNNC